MPPPRILLRVLLAVALAATLVPIARPAAALDAATFVAKTSAWAQAEEREYGVPASVAMAQAILESGWGESSLTKNARNWFGIKCSSTVSPYQNGCYAVSTTEYDSSGTAYTTTAQFRKYDTDQNSFIDHGYFLSRLTRYAKAFSYTNNPDRFIVEVHLGGYATDPQYANKVINLMVKYNLYQYNVTAPATGASELVIRPQTQAKVGATAYVTGLLSPSGAGLEVLTQVYTSSGWSIDQRVTSGTRGQFSIPLTFGTNTVGKTTYRVQAASSAGTMTSAEFTVNRLAPVAPAPVVSPSPSPSPAPTPTPTPTPTDISKQYKLTSSGPSSGTTFIASAGSYVSEGTAPAGSPVVVWYNNPNVDSVWRESIRGAAASDGRYRLTNAIGPGLATYRFTATTGAQPTSSATAVTVDIRHTTFALTTTGEREGTAFVAGSGAYLGTGIARPGNKVVMWWNRPSYDAAWRISAEAVADSTGRYRVTAPIGPWAATYRFTSTPGSTPGALDPAPATAEIVVPGQPIAVGSTGVQRGSTLAAGFGNYRHSGTAAANRTVQIWWNNPNHDSTWRPSVKTTSTATGTYSVENPIGPWAATYRWAATYGATPVGGSPVATVSVVRSPYAWSVTTTGHQIGTDFVADSGSYVFTGKALSSSPIQVWWNNPAYDSAWRPSAAKGVASSDGTFSLTHAIGPWPATYRFTVTHGNTPNAAAPAAVTVRVVYSAVALQPR